MPMVKFSDQEVREMREFHAEGFARNRYSEGWHAKDVRLAYSVQSREYFRMLCKGDVRAMVEVER